jgi:hypothetical protein
MDEQPSSTKKTVPAGIKVISVLYYIVAVIEFLSAVLIIAISSFLANPYKAINPELTQPGGSSAVLAGLSTVIIVLLVIFFLGFAILSYRIGKDLRNLKQWARITALVLTGLSSVCSLVIIPFRILTNNTTQAIMSIITLGISLLIFLYLLIHPKVKEAFT